MNKIKLCLISLGLSGCGLVVPNPPEIWQCAYAGAPRAFYCVNSETKEKKKLSADDPSMKGAQCMSGKDYKKSEAWVKDVIDIARTRCE